MAKQSNYKSYAWLLIFVPSLSYYLYRLSQTYFSAVYLHVESNVIIHNSIKSKKIFATASFAAAASSSSMIMLELVSQNYTLLNGISWFHDIELGRGYLLLSDIIDNRIWRWEVGGGPITIGKSLHMERAGCRSKHCNLLDSNNKKIGSAALSILPELDENAKDMLIISEYGEERLIKLEVEDGARNPLIYDVKIRDFVLLPPLGDIIYINDKIIDIDDGGNSITSSIWKVKEGVSSSTIPATESRAAHDKQWKGRDLLNKPESILNITRSNDNNGDDEVVGIVMLDWDHVIVTAKLENKLLLLKIFVGDEDLNDEDDDYWEKNDEKEVDIQPDGTVSSIEDHIDVAENTTSNVTTNEEEVKPEKKIDNITSLPKHITILQDISALLPLSTTYTKIGIPTLDSNNNLYIPIPNYGILIFDITTPTTNIELISTLQIPSLYYCDQIAFGDDYYLYMSCQTKLIRVRMLVQGKKMEKDLYKKKKVKKVF